MMYLVSLLSALLALQPGPDGATDAPPTTVEEVVVQGRTEAVVREFVDGLTVGEGLDGQIGRFDRRVCPGVINMASAAAQHVVDRVAGAAMTLGLSVGEPGCRPNIIIVAARDADSIARLLADENGAVFRRHAFDLGGDMTRLERFLESDAPIRWWHVTEPEMVGTPRQAPASRISSQYRTNILGSVVIVDLDRLPEVGLTALGDYIAMVSLAQLEPDHDTGGVDTILNLFAVDEGAPDGLTDFDRDYLEALYDARRDVRSGSRQRSQIVWRMMRQASQDAD